MKRYENIDQKVILQKWLNFNKPFGVYIHSPFCPSICKFCIYAGVKHKNSDIFNEYYNSYLPSIINFYKPVLEKKSNNITSWFFGGGTPSLIPPDKLDNLLKSIPNFKNHKGEKVFELHPGAFNIEQLDVLKEYNFDVIILCQQTLDQQTLKDQNRVPSDLDNLIFLANECRKRNFKIGLDIISFLNKKESDITILKKDLELTFDHISPDQISVQCLYQEKRKEHDYNSMTVDAVFDSHYVTKNNYFVEAFINKPNYSLIDLKNTYKNLKCLRLYKKDTKINFSCVAYMDPSWQHGFSSELLKSTLALGSFKNPFTQTHSNINEFNYIEVNTDNKTPYFKFVSSSFLDEIDFLTSIFKKAGDPPPDLQFTFDTKFISKDQIPLFLSFNISSNTTVGQEYIKVFYSFLHEEERLMLDRLKNKNKYQQILMYN